MWINNVDKMEMDTSTNNLYCFSSSFFAEIVQIPIHCCVCSIYSRVTFSSLNLMRAKGIGNKGIVNYFLLWVSRRLCSLQVVTVLGVFLRLLFMIIYGGARRMGRERERGGGGWGGEGEEKRERRGRRA